MAEQAAGIEKGSGEAGHRTGGRITRKQLRQIARRKMPELNAIDLAGTEKVVAGSARSMGIEIVE